jgi:hypothetical protein
MIENVVNTATNMMHEHPTWRTGQAYFNALYTLYPEVADAVRATDADPFYQDSRLDAFFEAILAHKS